MTRWDLLRRAALFATIFGRLRAWTPRLAFEAPVLKGVQWGYDGKPDQVVLDSWLHTPQHAVPETDPTTFTASIMALRRALGIGDAHRSVLPKQQGIRP